MSSGAVCRRFWSLRSFQTLESAPVRKNVTLPCRMCGRRLPVKRRNKHRKTASCVKLCLPVSKPRLGLAPLLSPGRKDRSMRKEHYQSGHRFFHTNGLQHPPEAPSLAGKRFKLNERTLAIEVLDNGRSAVTIPVAAIIDVASDPTSAINNDQTIDLLWGNRKLEMFRCDVNMRGVEINAQSGGAIQRSRTDRRQSSGPTRR
jgi:hypothetical protein